MPWTKSRRWAVVMPEAVPCSWLFLAGSFGFWSWRGLAEKVVVGVEEVAFDRRWEIGDGRSGRGLNSDLQSSDAYAPRTLRSDLRARGRLPLLVGVRDGAAASSTLGAFSRHPLYTRDVLRAVMRLSMEYAGLKKKRTAMMMMMMTMMMAKTPIVTPIAKMAKTTKRP